MGMKADGNGLRWTVVSIPSSTKRVAELKVQTAASRAPTERRKAVEVETPMPSAERARSTASSCRRSWSSAFPS